MNRIPSRAFAVRRSHPLFSATSPFASSFRWQRSNGTKGICGTIPSNLSSTYYFSVLRYVALCYGSGAFSFPPRHPCTLFLRSGSRWVEKKKSRTHARTQKTPKPMMFVWKVCKFSKRRQRRKDERERERKTKNVYVRESVCTPETRNASAIQAALQRQHFVNPTAIISSTIIIYVQGALRYSERHYGAGALLKLCSEASKSFDVIIV